MPRRHGDHQPLLAQRDHGERAVGDRGPEEGEVDGPFAQGVQLVGDEHLAAERELDARQLVGEAPGERGQEAVGRRADAADRDVADRAGGDPTGLVGSAVDGREDRPGPLQVGGAGRGQVDAAGGADEELDAELGLEAPDLLGERRLGHVQPLGGATEVPLLGDRHEVAQVTQEIHISTRLKWVRY